MGISSAIAIGLGDLGVSAGTAAALAPVITGVGIGAAGGAALGAVTGGDPGMGALGGAITGGFIPAGGAIGGSVGGTTGAAIGDVAGGLAGGALGAGATGGNPLTGAALGGVSGGVAALTAAPSSAPTPPTSSAPAGAAPAGAPTGGLGPGAGGPSSAFASAAPSSVPLNVSTAGPSFLGGADTMTPTVANANLASAGVTGGSLGNFNFTGGGIGGGVGSAAPGAGGIGGGVGAATAGTAGVGGGVGATTGLPGNLDTALLSYGAPSTSPTAPTITPQGGGTFGNLFGTPANPTPITLTPAQAASAAAPVPTFQEQLGNLYAGGTGIPASAAAAPAAGAGTTAAAGGGGLFGEPGSFLNKISQPGALLAAGGLGYEALTQPKIPSIAGTTGTLQTEAGQLASQGQSLQSYLQTGTLPPGVQAGLNQAADAAKASIRSRYAAMGDSGSSAEAQDLANVDQVTASQGANIAMQLLQQGVSETNLSANLYQTILNTALQQNQQLSSAIGNFASAAAGGGGLSLKLAGA